MVTGHHVTTNVVSASHPTTSKQAQVASRCITSSSSSRLKAQDATCLEIIVCFYIILNSTNNCLQWLESPTTTTTVASNNDKRSSRPSLEFRYVCSFFLSFLILLINLLHRLWYYDRNRTMATETTTQKRMAINSMSSPQSPSTSATSGMFIYILIFRILKWR